MGPQAPAQASDPWWRSSRCARGIAHCSITGATSVVTMTAASRTAYVSPSMRASERPRAASPAKSGFTTWRACHWCLYPWSWVHFSIGGCGIGVFVLGLGAPGYLTDSLWALELQDVWGAVLKALTFGFIIKCLFH